MSVTTNLVIATLGLSTLGGAAYTKSRMAPLAVNVTNTPNVSVTNTPNVSVTNTPNVSVTNTPTVNVATMPSVRIEEMHTPVGFRQDLETTSLYQEVTDQNAYVVPQGMQLVITNISGVFSCTSPEFISYAGVRVGESGSSRSQFIVPVRTGTNSESRSIFVADEEAHLVVDAGSHVRMFIGRGNAIVGTPTAGGQVEFNGYLQPMPQ